MKSFKEQLKEEGIIFIHNTIMVVFLLFGYHLLENGEAFGQIIGAISFIYGIKMMMDALKKGVIEFMDTLNYKKGE